jgi:quercetin dioxygenase-like cupin family protein
MDIPQSVDNLPWRPHPIAKGVKIKPLITREDTGSDVTCMLVQVPAGVNVPEHIHDDQADILYPLEGKGRMWIQGQAPFDLVPGIIVHVPAGTPHKIEEVEETLLVYDVFQPALF